MRDNVIDLFPKKNDSRKIVSLNPGWQAVMDKRNEFLTRHPDVVPSSQVMFGDKYTVGITCTDLLIVEYGHDERIPEGLRGKICEQRPIKDWERYIITRYPDILKQLADSKPKTVSVEESPSLPAVIHPEWSLDEMLTNAAPDKPCVVERIQHRLNMNKCRKHLFNVVSLLLKAKSATPVIPQLFTDTDGASMLTFIPRNSREQYRVEAEFTMDDKNKLNLSVTFSKIPSISVDFPGLLRFIRQYPSVQGTYWHPDDKTPEQTGLLVGLVGTDHSVYPELSDICKFLEFGIYPK